MSKVYLRFEGSHRDWRPMPGYENETPKPEGTVWELICQDTGEYAWGSSFEQAYSRLLEAKASAAQWRALRDMGYLDKEISWMDQAERDSRAPREGTEDVPYDGAL